MNGLKKSANQLQARFLGGITFYIGEERVESFRTRKAEAMMIYLTCNTGIHEREYLADLFWSDLSRKRGLANLRVTLSNLRSIFDDCFEITRYTVNLSEPIATDIHLLDAIDTNTATIAELETAIAAYRGEFLQGFQLKDALAFMDWKEAQAYYWHRKVITLLHRLIDLYTYQGEYDAVISYCQHLLEIDALDEEAHYKLMLALARLGRRHLALQQYESCRALLGEELGISPMPRLQALHTKLVQSDAIRSHNLPTLSTGISVERQFMLPRLQQHLMNPAIRLITLLGLGGTGKTHLALQLAWTVAEDYYGPFLDGVFLVNVYDRSQGKRTTVANLATAIATALDLDLSQDKPIQRQLLDFLKQKELLLIINNGELLDQQAIYLIHHILKATSAVQILVTSREQLHIDGEYILRVKGLAYPEQAEQITNTQEIENLIAYESVQMFLATVQQVTTHIDSDALTVAQATALLQIVQAVEGLPLAIKLLAAWSPILSLPEIADKINDGIAIVKAQEPVLYNRHASIHAVFEQSWKLLSRPEQQTAQALAVFEGSFDKAAAAVVADTGAELLATLVAKSMLESQIYNKRQRFQMHNLLRQFIREKPYPQQKNTKIALAEYFGNVCQQLNEQLNGSQTQAIIKRIQTNIGNLRQGCHYARQYDLKYLTIYINILYHYYMYTTAWEDGIEFFNSLIADISVDTTDNHLMPILASVLPRLASLQYGNNDIDLAKQTLTASMRVSHTVEEPQELVITYKRIANLLFDQGSYQSAIRHMEFALDVASDSGLLSSEAHTAMSLGFIHQNVGNYKKAGALYDRSEKLYTTTENEWGIANILRLQGELSVRQGAPMPQIYERSWQLTHELGNSSMEALILNNQAELCLLQDQYDDAFRLLQSAHDLCEDHQNKRVMSLIYINLMWLSRKRENYDECLSYFISALEIEEKLKRLHVLRDLTVQFILYALACDRDTLAIDMWSALCEYILLPSQQTYYEAAFPALQSIPVPMTLSERPTSSPVMYLIRRIRDGVEIINHSTIS